MQKKRSTRSKVPDLLVTLICLAGIGVNLSLFWNDLNRTMTRLNESPVGTISFKHKSAQRRFIDRVLWDRLQQESPVYNGDIIRTANLSEATVTFISGQAVELMENTLAQIFFNDDGTFVDFSEGSISVSTEGAAGSLRVSSEGNTVDIAPGGIINASAGSGGQGFNLRVIEGSALLSNAEGSRAAEAGSVFALSADGSMSIDPLVAVLSPRPNARLLSAEQRVIPVAFSWHEVNFSDGMHVRIELAEDRGFSQSLKTYDIRDDVSVQIDVEAGTYWWRAYPVPQDAGENAAAQEELSALIRNAASGKLTLLYAPAPEIIAPAQDYVYRYRTKMPAVRFLWSAENTMVSQYQIAIADNPGMNNPRISRRIKESSMIYAGLDAGSWYWQITPLYPNDFEGAVVPSRVSSFVIQQGGALTAPVPSVPVAGSFVNISEERGDSYFSWRNEDEAVSYTIRISKSENLDNPVINSTVHENYYTYGAAQRLLETGQYFWGVYQTDIEGNDSPVSEARPFLALEGEIIQRTIFPPDTYMAAEARLPDMRFTWRTNLPFTSRFQISESQDFSSLLVDQPVNGSSVSGNILPQGSYYWRISADTGSQAVSYSTAPKQLIVPPPLPAAEVERPLHYSRVVVREGIPVDFRWKGVPGADYYQVKIFNVNNTDIPVYEDLTKPDTSFSLPMDDWEEGNYFWTIQAFVLEGPLTSRRSGMLTQSNFTMKKLRPVVLESPVQGHEFGGLEAIRNPGTLRWSSTDAVLDSRFMLSRNPDLASDPDSLIMDIHNPDRNIRLVRLGAGVWYWTIEAETDDELDISAESPSWFRVLPIQPLPEAGRIRPPDQYVFGPAELRETRRIIFEWNTVQGANAYTFKLFKLDDSGNIPRVPLVSTSPIDSTSYTLEDLSILDRGIFKWQVEAVFIADDGYVEQPGTIGENQFTIDLPVSNKPKTHDPGALYGN